MVVLQMNQSSKSLSFSQRNSNNKAVDIFLCCLERSFESPDQFYGFCTENIRGGITTKSLTLLQYLLQCLRSWHRLATELRARTSTWFSSDACWLFTTPIFHLSKEEAHLFLENHFQTSAPHIRDPFNSDGCILQAPITKAKSPRRSKKVIRKEECLRERKTRSSFMSLKSRKWVKSFILHLERLIGVLFLVRSARGKVNKVIDGPWVVLFIVS
mmetsp:Transcript_35686/g.55733  ORF Transcript_35686/g.55733 Transcript_35686/m.55733 type:complete len:214 (-) Transcript_35686:2659-3300(-)